MGAGGAGAVGAEGGARRCASSPAAPAATPGLGRGGAAAAPLLSRARLRIAALCASAATADVVLPTTLRRGADAGAGAFARAGAGGDTGLIDTVDEAEETEAAFPSPGALAAESRRDRCGCRCGCGCGGCRCGGSCRCCCCRCGCRCGCCSRNCSRCCSLCGSRWGSRCCSRRGSRCGSRCCSRCGSRCGFGCCFGCASGCLGGGCCVCCCRGRRSCSTLRPRQLPGTSCSPLPTPSTAAEVSKLALSSRLTCLAGASPRRTASRGLEEGRRGDTALRTSLGLVEGAAALSPLWRRPPASAASRCSCRLGAGSSRGRCGRRCSVLRSQPDPRTGAAASRRLAGDLSLSTPAGGGERLRRSRRSAPPLPPALPAGACLDAVPAVAVGSLVPAVDRGGGGGGKSGARPGSSSFAATGEAVGRGRGGGRRDGAREEEGPSAPPRRIAGGLRESPTSRKPSS